MGLFDQIRAALSGEAADRQLMGQAARLLLNLDGSVSDGERAALGQVASDLTRRFGHDYDVVQMNPHEDGFRRAVEARSDLLAVASAPFEPSPSSVATQIKRDLQTAALFFYYLIALRGLQAHGSKSLRLEAGNLADRFSRILIEAFPA